MKTDEILKANVLDIIFEHRNKNYGAYPLRKFYNNRLYKAMAAVFGLACLMALFSFFYKEESNSSPFSFDDTTHMRSVLHEELPAKPVVPVAHQPAAATQPSLAHVVIAPPDRVTTNIPAITGPSGPATTVNIVPGGIGDPGVPSVTTVPDPPAAPVAPAVDVNTPIFAPEIMPQFPGGASALHKFLEKYLVNPQDLNSGESISVKIRFVVGFDGSVKSFEIVQDGGAAFNNEVIRVLKKMPQWIPGKTRGQNVSVYYVIPVTFTAAAE